MRKFRYARGVSIRRALPFLALTLALPVLVRCVGNDPTSSDSPSADGGVDGSSGPDPSSDGGGGGADGGGGSDAGVPLLEDAVAVSAGRLHTCAITAGQDVLCWGSNGSGQLGVPAAQVPQSSRPVKVDIGGKATAVAAGGAHTCAILTDGSIKCWGKNERGQLGRGTLVATGGVDVVSPPNDNVNLWKKAEVVTAGLDHTCVGVFEGDLNGIPGRRFFCWGENVARQLGTEQNNGQPVPTPVLITYDGAGGLVPSVSGTAVGAGADFSCAAYYGAAGAAYFSTVGCWGSRVNGQIGAPAAAGFERSLKFPSTKTDGSESPLFGLFKPGLLAVGQGHGCIRFEQSGVTPHQLDCWGNNTKGQTGTATIGARPIEKVAGFDATDVTALAAGGQTTCVIDAGQVKCMGANDTGQLGNGTLDGDAHATLAAAMLAPTASAISVGASHACAVLGGAAAAKGPVACWGQNQNGQLGDGLDLAAGYPGAPEAEKRIRTAPVRVVAPL